MVRQLIVLWCFGCLVVWAGEDASNGLPDMNWRNLGPYNMSGRVADVEAVPGKPGTVYVGSASGGIWKSNDGGVTFRQIFEKQGVPSIGDLALAPGNPEVIYAGTGEANVRNSVSIGNGVFRSTNGGETWQHLGLEETRHISRIAVHPSNSNVVHVGAVGHIYGPHPDRGVFRSEDGGQTWKKVLYIDEWHGVSDLDQSLSNPNILYAGMWYFNRKPWTHTSGSEKGGLYRSLDGGLTWEKAGKGLPKLMGRIAVKIAQSQPNTVYVLAESNDGILFRSDDYGATFRKINDDVQLVSRGFYYTDLRVDPQNPDRLYAVASRMFRSIDGGKHFDRISWATHVDYHSLWIDPTNPKHLWQGQDGGVAVSYNGGDTWEPVRNLPIAQFYQIYADSRFPFYHLGGGLQDNGTWTGPARTREPAGVLPDLWEMVSFGDAYFVVAHPGDPDYLISEYQAGGIVRTQMRTRQQQDISPQPLRNDGGPVGELPVRFNWNAPIIGSVHQPKRVYFAGSVVYRSEDFGTSWTQISPDLTTNDPEKQKTAGGPVWPENTTAEYHCTIISFAESPLDENELWVGSDDGLIHLSQDGGEHWTKLNERLKGVPEFSPVSHIEPSHHQEGRAYLAFDRHMFDDYAPHLYVTQDKGKSWKKLGTEGLDEKAWIWVVREDRQHPEILYLGTEFGLYISYDSGQSWRRPGPETFPVVSVQDIYQHPVANDLIVGTHGRGIWVLDDLTPLQQWASVEKAGKPHLFGVRDAVQYTMKFNRYGIGNKTVVAPNPDYGALIAYRLPSKAENEKDGGEGKDGEAKGDGKKDELKMKILDASGNEVFTFKNLPSKPGFHRVAWALCYDAAKTFDGGSGNSDFFGPVRGERVLPGSYRAVLSWDGGEAFSDFQVTVDPELKVSLEDLKEVQQICRDLKAKVTGVNRALHSLEEIKAQLDNRKSLKEDLEKDTFKDFEKRMAELRGILVREEGKPYWSQGPQLKDLLERLMGNIDGAYAAPSDAQRALYDKLVGDYGNFQIQYRDFVEKDLPKIQEQLAGLELPKIFVQKD